MGEELKEDSGTKDSLKRVLNVEARLEVVGREITASMETFFSEA